MDDMRKDAVKLYRPAVHTDGAACMVDCKIGFWVSKPDYDALAVKLAEVEEDRDDALIALASARKQLERYIGEAKAERVAENDLRKRKRTLAKLRGATTPKEPN